MIHTVKQGLESEGIKVSTVKLCQWFAELGLRERRRLFVALSRARLQVALVTSERAARVIVDRLSV